MLPIPTEETVLKVLDSTPSFDATVERIKKESPEIGKLISQDRLKLVDIVKRYPNLTRDDIIILLAIANSQGTLIYLVLEAQDRINNG